MAVHTNCHVIAVTGGKGGVGKSLFAANLAMALRIELKSPVLLVDLDSKSCGDQNVILGLRPNKILEEITSYTGIINANSIATIITPHPSGLHFIGAVRGADDNLNLSPDLVSKTIETLSAFYRFIVVDLGSTLTATQMTLLELSSVALMVITPEILVLNQTTKLMNQLTTATFPNDMFQIVANKTGRIGLPLQSLGQTLHKQIFASIPQDDLVTSESLKKSTPFVLGQSHAPISIAFHELVRKLTGGVLQKSRELTRPQNQKSTLANPDVKSDDSTPSTGKKNDPRNILKMRIHNELIIAMDLKKGITDTKGDPKKEKALAEKTQQTISQIIDKVMPGAPRSERSKIIKEVLDEALFLGPIEDLLSDPTISEIMVNGYDRIFVERNGKLVLSQITFTSNLQLRTVIERIVTPLGRRIDEKTPYVDARIKGGVADGSRVNAIIEPLSIDGPALTIRKFSKDPITPENYIKWGTTTQSMIDFLRICVENGLNIIVSGGTGSGKTTLLNVLSGFIPTNERIITVEDAAELQLKQEHVVRLETRPSNLEGSGAITIRDLIRNSLRMRPDRIVVGECRDGSALDMLSAMNTGHDGSMTTVHSNNPREAIARLETLCLMAGMELPTRAIREQISGAVNLIIQISRLSDGSRKVTSMTEVVGMQGETVTLQEIFRFKEEGFDKNRKIIGQFQPTGLIPTFIEEFEQRGVIIPRNIFSLNPADQKPKTTENPLPQKPFMMRPPIKKTGGNS